MIVCYQFKIKTKIVRWKMKTLFLIGELNIEK